MLGFRIVISQFGIVNLIKRYNFDQLYEVHIRLASCSYHLASCSSFPVTLVSRLHPPRSPGSSCTETSKLLFVSGHVAIGFGS